MLNKNNTVSYVGASSNLWLRVNQHRQGVYEGFTARYNIHKLVYFEFYKSIVDAISREKQLKKWSGGKKMELIRKSNPTLRDLYADLEKEYG